MLEVFYEAVSLKRAAGSLEEAQFVAWLARRYPPTLIDQAGNLHYDRRISSERTLFVAHTDTAHGRGGLNKFEVQGDLVRAVGSPLGADDAAGIQILCHMMDANVPGYYIFTRGEEVGGVGAEYLMNDHPMLLEQFDRAIAFDRKDTWSVITHQVGRRCASEEFAEALAGQLNDQGLIYMPDPTGIFTDTAVWMDIIPECTNISCGYMDQHSDKETQSISFLESLMAAAVGIEWEKLPTARNFTNPHVSLTEDQLEAYKAVELAALQGKTSTLASALVSQGYLTEAPTCKLRRFAEEAFEYIRGDKSGESVELVMWSIANRVKATMKLKENA